MSQEYIIVCYLWSQHAVSPVETPGPQIGIFSKCINEIKNKRKGHVNFSWAKTENEVTQIDDRFFFFKSNVLKEKKVLDGRAERQQYLTSLKMRDEMKGSDTVVQRRRRERTRGKDLRDNSRD